MGKDNFLKYFQNNVKTHLDDLVVNRWRQKEFIVASEDNELPGLFQGFIDISIYNPDIVSSITAIEIEHISNYDQAMRNIQKLKTWTHNSKLRYCGFLHIFNVDCRFSNKNNISSIVRFAREIENRNKGFFYDYMFYEVCDKRKTAEYAGKLVDSKDFQYRLWMLMQDANMV
jgi:hypothetical protein